MTDKERKEAIYCLARHFEVSHKQCCNNEISDIAEACVDCKLRKEGKCNPEKIKDGKVGWIEKTDALLRENGLAICILYGTYERLGYEWISKFPQQLK